MRFFSNDARESTDEQAQNEQAQNEQAQNEQGRNEQAQNERADRVQSDPVAVPGQRPPSPWSDTPPASDDTSVVAEPGRRGDAEAERRDTDPAPFHEPSPQPTAFGASSVGGAVASSAMANPVNDRWNATDRDSAADTGVGDDANVAPGDGVVTSSTNTYAGSTAGADRDPDDVVDLPLDDRNATATGTVPAGAVSANAVSAGTASVGPVAANAAADNSASDNSASDSSASDRSADVAEPEADRDSADDENPPLKDDGTFDDPKAVDPATDKPLASSTVDDDTRTEQEAGSTATDAVPLKDDGGFDDPKAVDPATDKPIEATDAAVPVAAAAAAPAADTLFAAADAQTLQERWRDVQLRFVDSPKDAAVDAAKLVDEAVEKLTAGLRAQRDGLHADTEDTEQLRIQLRGYRDILNRILAL